MQYNNWLIRLAFWFVLLHSFTSHCTEINSKTDRRPLVETENSVDYFRWLNAFSVFVSVQLIVWFLSEPLIRTFAASLWAPACSSVSACEVISGAKKQDFWKMLRLLSRSPQTQRIPVCNFVAKFIEIDFGKLAIDVKQEFNNFNDFMIVSRSLRARKFKSEVNNSLDYERKQ